MGSGPMKRFLFSITQVPETPSYTVGAPGILTCLLGYGSHSHTDLSLGRQQVLQAGSSGSVLMCLVAVPALDGDGGLVHLVDEPARTVGLRTEVRPHATEEAGS